MPAFEISIHAPTRGATLTRDTVKMIVEFQSTLPREERRGYPTSYRLSLDFNPRSHERSDYHSISMTSSKSKFQSTLPREERHQLLHLVSVLKLFQSTLPREERQLLFYYLLYIILFQSTLPREERRHFPLITQEP